VKPARFEYECPTDTAAALALAGRDDVTVKFIAGGQSLGPMLNLRLAQPDVLVDLTGIAELTQVEETVDSLSIGACVTHADIEDGRVPDLAGGMLRSVAHGIAYRAVRNRGTIGGSVAHADPSADWISCLAALGASVVVRSASGRRAVPVEEFMLGVFETALLAGELVEAVTVPRLSSQARWGFYKVCRKTGEFADAIGAVLFDPARSVCRAVIGAIESRPVVFAHAHELFRGRPESRLLGSFDPQPAREALAAAGIIDTIGQQIHLVALRRAIEQASA
jgi:aerobic carbon-monoxide dehydrogenase medium subunit